MRFASRTLAMAAFLGAIGCNPPQTPEQLKDYITIRYSGGSSQMKVTPERIWGADADVSRVPEGYRGTVHHSLIDLRLDNDKKSTIKGSRGGQPVDLQLQASGETLIMQGMWGGKLSSLEVGPAALKGRFGNCSYDTKAAPAQGVSYSGSVSCGRMIGPVSIILPEATRTMRIDETAAMLTLALAP